MSAAVVSHPITVLAPGPIRKELTSEFFDKGHRAFARYPVSAEYDGQDFSSPGIAFEDYRRMATITHKQSGERRLSTPDWVLRPALLRKVLVHYVERRAGFRKPTPGTESERLERASRINVERCRLKEATLRKLCAEFVELKNSGADPVCANNLAEQIENLDTCLRVDRHIAGIALRCVHLYFSVGLDSVGVATEMGLKPPHVRALIWKLNWVWQKLNGTAKPRWRHGRELLRKTNIIDAMAKKGIPYSKIAEKVGLTSGQIYRLLKKSGRWKPRVVLNPLRVPRAPHQKGRTPYLQHQRFSADRAVGLYFAGKSVYAIAIALGYAPDTGQNRVRHALIKAGVYKKQVVTAKG